MMAMENFKRFLVLLVSALSVGFVCIVFVLRWVFHFKEGLAWDGGLAEFNWHPLLIVIGFIFLQGIAIIVYRLPWTWRCSKLMMKFIHAGLNILAFIMAVVSLVAVFDFHNAANIPNMYSLHSWVGLAAVILYALQMVLGLVVYLVPITPGFVRAALMPVHVYGGLFIFSSVIATALMGITEKLIFGLKDPKYKDSPPEAVFVNVLGLLLAVFGGLILWIATRPQWKRPAENQLRLAHSDNLPAASEAGANGGTANAALTMTTGVGGERAGDQEGNGEPRRRNGKGEESAEGGRINI